MLDRSREIMRDPGETKLNENKARSKAREGSQRNSDRYGANDWIDLGDPGCQDGDSDRRGEEFSGSPAAHPENPFEWGQASREAQGLTASSSTGGVANAPFN
jgi:hypothetical protein